LIYRSQAGWAEIWRPEREVRQADWK